MVNAVAKYQKYAEYKDSGVEWLGEIPSHWNISKVKFLSPFQVGWTPPTKDDSNFIGKNLWVNISDLKEKVITDTAKKISDKAALEASMDITPKGSLMYSFKLSVGSVAFAGLDLYTNEAVASFLNTSKLPLSYLYYALPEFVIKNASTNIYGANILNQELIRNANLVAIPYLEAENIANFLDHETAKIDCLIAKQHKLIELLKEKRQAVISHAVTKGLNPDVPMKDSGVEWLGQVPEHWKVIKFNHCVQIRNGLVDPRHEDFKKLTLYAPNHIEKGTGKVTYKETAEEQGADSNKYLCYKGEVIYSKIRPALAKVAICDDEIALCSADMYPMDAFNGLNNDFLYYFILSDSFTEAVILDSDRVAMPKINRESLSEYKLPIPPVDEQIQIINFIQNTGQKLDNLENQAQRAIQLMQERRTALISSAVTGKIDVRHWQNPHHNNNEAQTELSL